MLPSEPSDLPLSPGQILAGRFRVERVLGTGGMGAVVAAEHLDLRQRVAIKLLRAEVAYTPEALERFLREARAAARLKSEHVAHVMDAGKLDCGWPYIVMEYLDGANLAEVLRVHGPLRLMQLVDYALQALDALAEAHQLGIVHRDLKPSNLFLTSAPDGQRLIKVLDFGISKVPAELRILQELTSASSTLGSPAYMSPEQLADPSNVDPRSDIWSLGVTLHELCAGKPPFDGPTLARLIAAIGQDPPPGLTELRPDVPEPFARVVRTCLAKDRNHRFQNAAELALALARLVPTAQVRWRVDRIVRISQGATEPSAGRPDDGDSDLTVPRFVGADDEEPTTLQTPGPEDPDVRTVVMPPAVPARAPSAVALIRRGMNWWYGLALALAVGAGLAWVISQSHSGPGAVADVPSGGGPAPSHDSARPPPRGLGDHEGASQDRQLQAISSAADDQTANRVARSSRSSAVPSGFGPSTSTAPTTSRAAPRDVGSGARRIDTTNPFAPPPRPIDRRNPFVR